MKGESWDICNLYADKNTSLSVAEKNFNLPVRSYFCSGPNSIIEIIDKNNKIDIALGTIENRDTKNSIPIKEFIVYDYKFSHIYNYWATYFDEYGC